MIRSAWPVRRGWFSVLLTVGLVVGAAAGCTTVAEPEARRSSRPAWSSASASASSSLASSATPTLSPPRPRSTSRSATTSGQPSVTRRSSAASTSTAPTATAPPGTSPTNGAAFHVGIVATTFWVGEIFDPNAADGSQMISTYDAHWFAHYGGCDGVVVGSECRTEKRTALYNYFPSSMTPLQNPFYLDLPYDDINDRTGFARRCAVIGWANQPGFAGHCDDDTFSYLKNHWVELVGPNGQTCFGQIEDAGPGLYHDEAYVFGTAAPSNRRYGGAGMDVSPALNGCLGFADLNDASSRVSWRFVDEGQVPAGPWRILITTQPVD